MTMEQGFKLDIHRAEHEQRAGIGGVILYAGRIQIEVQVKKDVVILVAIVILQLRKWNIWCGDLFPGLHSQR